jgi:tetratricopeptide (TPR) repeat protein
MRAGPPPHIVVGMNSGVWSALICAALALGPTQGEGAYQQGIDAFNRGQYQDAAQFFAEAAARNPQVSDALLREGKALIKLEKFADAEKVLRGYAEEDKDSADALYLLGLVLFREEKAKESLDTYTEAAKLRKPAANDLTVVSFDYVLLNDYPAAIHWLEVAVGMEAGNYEAWYALGRCYYTRGRFPEAEHAFRHALAVNAGSAKAHSNLGLTLAQQDKSVEAERQLREGARLADADAHTTEWPYLNLAKYLLEHDRAGDAIPELKRAVHVAAHCGGCHEKLGQALARIGKLDEGIAELRRAAGLAPKNPEVHRELGNVYRAAGRLDDAKAEMALSSKLYGSSEWTGEK